LHMAQLMPLPLTVSCFSKIQIGFTFLVPAHLDSPGQRAVKWVCVFQPKPLYVTFILNCMLVNYIVFKIINFAFSSVVILVGLPYLRDLASLLLIQSLHNLLFLWYVVTLYCI